VLVLWLLGFIGSIGGAFIHFLLVLAVLMLIFRVLSPRASV